METLERPILNPPVHIYSNWIFYKLLFFEEEEEK